MEEFRGAGDSSDSSTYIVVLIFSGGLERTSGLGTKQNYQLCMSVARLGLVIPFAPLS